MMLKTTKLRDAIVFALVMGTTTAFGTGVAFAQGAEEEDKEDSTELETVVVTGTRIESQTVTASSPVTEIQREEFTFAGATRVDDLINQYPQMNPVFDSFQNNPSLGYPTLDLRGLGPQRTLTLVNGNRLAPGAAIFTDISVIPAALVSRVDILTGGASAVYGSDAVAGVVNFILDTEFEGVSINAGYGGYQHDNDNKYIQGKLDARNFDYPTGNSGLDGVSRNIDIAVGSTFADGAGHAMAWLTWRENDALFQGQRDYSSCALNAAGTTCGGSATNATGNFYFFQTNDFLNGTSASIDQTTGRFVNSYGAPYNYAPINYFQRPDERHTFGSSLKYEINEHVRPYVELMYANKRDSVQIAESGAFFTRVDGFTCTSPTIGTACADLGLDPTLPVSVYVAKRNIEGGPRRTETENSTYRVVAGAEGDINDSWSYNASFLYGHTANDLQGFNDFLSDRIVSAILGCPEGSFAGCVPYNVFRPLGPNGVTPAAAAALAGVSFNKTESNLSALNAYVTGDLGFGFPSADGENVSVVFGVESRKEDYDFNADSNSQAGNFAGSGGAALPVRGDIQVLDIYMEGAIPLLTNVGIVESLALDVGYRHSDYERSGGENSYKFGMTADFGDYRVRGGFNRAIRAPNVIELFNPRTLALFGGEDKCAGATPVFTAAQCANSGVTAAQYGRIAANPAGQYNQFIGGTSTLVPETGDTWTFGFVAQPIEDLSLNIDYYQIEIEDRIGGIGAASILEACGQSGLLCNLIRRSATGDLWRGSNLATSGYVTNITDNFGEQTFRGVDLGAAYGWEWLGGRWSTSLQGTYMLEQETVPVPGNDSTTFDCAGQINIACQANEWRHVANVRFARDWYTLNLRWRYFSELDYVNQFTGAPLTVDRLLCSPSNNAACLGDGGVDAFNYFDVSAAFVIGQIGELTVGVNNIADKEPPLVGNTVALNANAPGGYDQVGRQFFASFNFTF